MLDPNKAVLYHTAAPSLIDTVHFYPQASTSAAQSKGYAGKVDDTLDHTAYMPAAWRVDDYLDGERGASDTCLGL